MRTFPSVVLLGALALLAPTAIPARAESPSPGLTSSASGSSVARTPVATDRDGKGPHRRTDQRSGRRGAPDGYVLGTSRPQTSDGLIGPAAADLPSWLRNYRTSARTTRFNVAPGVNVVRWSENTARGPVRLSLLTVKYRTKGVTVDYANSGPVQQVGAVSDIVRRDGGVAGVNGDFYDIGDTGAPLGLGRDRQRGPLHGRLDGWNAAFSIDKSGRPDIGPLATVVRVKQHPDLRINGLNSPEVNPDGIAAYTPAWGKASGYRWTGGQRDRVRLVQVRDGKVVFTGTRLPSDRTWRGTLLIGRGAGADRLKALKRGARATLATYVETQPKMAITGNKFLVRDGVITVVDDREMHPRTAVGIDRDTRELLFLAVDGRASFSRGYTMVELADTMIRLGADEALNLDGGGSTTMVARRSGTSGLKVVNTPSDGFERRVANAVSIRYQKPR